MTPDENAGVAMNCSDFEELEYREIAKILNIPEGTVKSRLNRGRAELARILRRHKVAV